ncbi:MAG: GNAT family N-acetyltransferase [Chthonomonas sp.]|nr:GNAT family N-acetyltransferase [Chthonomonas sp.]
MIRLAQPTDSEGVVRTVRAVYDEYGFTWEEGGYHADLYDLRPYCDLERARFWVAELDGRVVGCGGIRFFTKIPGQQGELVIVDDYERVAGTSAEIIRMYVHPEARRSGIATAIMNEIKAATSEPIEIWSDKRFINAHRLYQRFGAEVVGERICHDPDQAPEWGMILAKNNGKAIQAPPH